MRVEDVPIFILCGGQGTRLREQTEFMPKPMVRIGQRPILWHIMNLYGRHGFRRFVLCLGYKAEMIKDYFLSYYELNNDSTIHLRSNKVEIHCRDDLATDWQVTLAFTGEHTMTGARIALAAEHYLGNAAHFGVTYGDGLTDADLGEEYRCHLSSSKIGTILGVNPPSRFGQFLFEGEQLTSFVEKPDLKNSWINGGFFFFDQKFLSYLTKTPSCVLEETPFHHLVENDQLAVYKHRGYWACMDTQRDWSELNRLWDSGEAPWLNQGQSAKMLRAV
jgi:glucose-1-phosphate cytidylyltransferase